MVGKLAAATGDTLSGETFSKLQAAIEAVDHAIADEHELASRMNQDAESFRARVKAV